MTLSDAVVLKVDMALPIPPLLQISREPSRMYLMMLQRTLLNVPVVLEPRLVVAAKVRVDLNLPLALAATVVLPPGASATIVCQYPGSSL